MVRRTLDGMAAGGIYDVVGGGFHRYSVDARWLVPHFEKMLYDNALLASAYLHAWVVTGEERYRRGRRGDARLPAARDAARERRLRVGAGRRHRRRRGPDVHLDAGGVGGARARAVAPRAVRARPLHRPRRARRRRRRRACSRSAPSGRSRFATTRRSPRGTASRSRRSPRRRGGSTATTGSRPRSELGEFLLGAAARRRRARAPQRARRPRRAAPGFLDDYANVAHGLLELHVATGDAALAARGAADRRPRASSCSPTTSAAASSSRRTTARSSPRARRTSTTTRPRRATRCSPPC